jgi:hypothetical protein
MPAHLRVQVHPPLGNRLPQVQQDPVQVSQGILVEAPDVLDLGCRSNPDASRAGS